MKLPIADGTNAEDGDRPASLEDIGTLLEWSLCFHEAT